MSSINIPPSLAALLAGGALPSAALAPVINPPPSLAAVPPGTVLDATVLSRSAATGIVTVQTAQGVFGFTSALAVPPGTALSLTVQGTPGQPQVLPSVVAPAAAQASPGPQAPTGPLISGAIVEAVLANATPPAPPPVPVAPAPATPLAAPAAAEIAGTAPPLPIAAAQAAPPPLASAPVAVPSAAPPTIGTAPPTTPNPTQPIPTQPVAAPAPPAAGATAGIPTSPNPFAPVSTAPNPFTPVTTPPPLPPSLLAVTSGAAAAQPGATPVALPITGAAAVVAALISQELAAAGAAAIPTGTAPPAAVATSPTAVPATGAATPIATAVPASGATATPAALAGLPAGERLLLRVLSVTAPALAEAIAAAEVTEAARPPVVAPPPVAPGTVAATPTAAGAPISAAAQVQATAAPQAAAPRAAQPTAAHETVAALPAQAASASGPVAAGAVQPMLRGDAGAALPAELPPEASSGAIAAQAAAAAETATAAAGAPSPAVPSPGASGAGAAITPGAGQFTATVVGTAANGQPVLLAGQSLMTVRAAPLEPGSQVVLQLASAPAGGALASGLVDAALRTSLPSLPELVTAAQLVGGPAQAALAAVVPQPGPALAGQMAMFLSGLQTGNLRAWIGEPARAALARAGAAALGKVDGELKKASSEQARSAAAGGWRSQGIPLSDGGAIVPIQLYVHQAKPDEEGADKGQAAKPPTRFLLDLELSALGRIQLDGLAQPPRFDLILRTPQALPDAVRNDLRLLFTDVTSARGLTGSVAFQVAPPVVPTGVTAQVPRPGILV